MSDTYKTSLSKLRNDHLKDLFQALEQVMTDQAIDFYFVGAFARDVWNAIHNITGARVTRDIDIAVLVPDAKQFKRFREGLIATGRFRPVSGNEVKFYFDGAVELDVIPFGGYDIFSVKDLSDLTAYIALPDNGFKEVYEAATPLVQFGDHWTYKVCSLPGIVLLKLLAYDEKPEVRIKDLQDIFQIIKHYFHIVDDLIYEEHLDLFDDDQSDTITMGARVLGRQLRPILEQNEKLKSRILDLLEREAAAGLESGMVIRMVQGMEETAVMVLKWLEALLAGIRD